MNRVRALKIIKRLVTKYKLKKAYKFVLFEGFFCVFKAKICWKVSIKMKNEP
jgi:hypothetical protein